MERQAGGCGVCGCSQVDVDQVDEAGTLHLAQCPRCEHRWTWRGAGPAHVRAVAAGARGRAARVAARTAEVASAA